MAVCESCDGTGFVLRVDERGVSASTPCICGENDRARQLARRARVPKRYDHCSFDNYEEHHPSQAEARKWAQQWVEEWPGVEHGLLLIGPPGTGKTHLAVALARELIERKSARVLFYEQRELLKALQGTFETGAALQESQVLQPFLTTEVAILDDIGAGRTTPWARDVLHDVIAQRYNEALPLILTSNLLPGDAPDAPKGVEAPMTLRDRLGDPLLSRLYEMCRIVVLEGQDYRRGVIHARTQI